MGLDAGDLGTIYVTGSATGTALFQTNYTNATGDHQSLLDFSNAQVSVQKADGLVQFYLQAGEYSLPSLGLPYVRASSASEQFGPVPVAYLKLAPSDSFNLEAGKLPTLIGAEYTFTFQNLNIERGLLWNQEPAISRGIQANYVSGPVSLSVSLNDGAYTDKYNQMSGLVSYALAPSDTFSFAGSGVLGGPGNPSSPLANESVFNFIWTHISGPWSATAYGQYTDVPRVAAFLQTSTWGGGALSNYAFGPNWSLGGRVEYVRQNAGSEPLLYGRDSGAWSVTITPTYQYKLFFGQADLSYVESDRAVFGSSLSSPGPGFGTTGLKTAQMRLVFEAGILF